MQMAGQELWIMCKSAIRMGKNVSTVILCVISCMIVGFRMAGLNSPMTAHNLGFSHTDVSRVYAKGEGPDWFDQTERLQHR